METAEIRRRYLSYFADRDHHVAPSASLISPDPTTMFVIAGMVPFIPYLTGQESAPWPRAVSVQKCVRTLDIEEVGKTTRHGTFFQMNGNFSFGDYFKAGAIEHAWNLVTGPQNEGGYGFDPDKIWVTVYHDDHESRQLWRSIAGLPDERIQARGMADNFWSTGVAGPCGPCSEIYVDRGPQYGPDGGPIVDEDRFLEIWNLVFMQNLRADGGTKDDFPVIGELPSKNIDTGMGLERVAYLLQGKENLYEIDEVYPVIARACELAEVPYGSNPDHDVRLRVVADHVRASLMLIGDGVTSSNEGRGYVLRRLMRRAVRAMRLLGVDEPTLPELLPVSMSKMSASYPELARDFDRISTVAYAEEEAFRRTLASGTTILDTAVRQTKSAGGTSLSGDQAFALHDTYGFPIDLTLEMAAEQGLSVDADRFRALMAEQRDRAKADSKAKKQGRADLSLYRQVSDALISPIDFLGYTDLSAEATVVALLSESAPVMVAKAGDRVEVVLDRTPFYAESGGQLADHGRLLVSHHGGVAGSTASLTVTDVQKPMTGLIVHSCVVESGEVTVNDQVFAEVDATRRRAISRAHTATHLVHQALRDALGPTATQAGSENSPGRLRFDFSWTGGVGDSTLKDIEHHVNAVLVDDTPVTDQVMGLDDARAMGAMALFGEKYGDRVRVVSIGDWSKELCGGTHAATIGQIGLVRLVSEGGIGSGVRRVEALVGLDAYAVAAREHALVSQVAGMLKTQPHDLPDRISSLVSQLKDAEKELTKIRQEQLLGNIDAVVASARPCHGLTLVTYDAGTVASADDLRTLATRSRHALGDDKPVVVVIAGVAGERPGVVVATTAPARERGAKAGMLVKKAAGVLGGGGGGKDDIAQGGGTNPTQVAAALAAMDDELARQVGA